MCYDDEVICLTLILLVSDLIYLKLFFIKLKLCCTSCNLNYEPTVIFTKELKTCYFKDNHILYLEEKILYILCNAVGPSSGYFCRIGYLKQLITCSGEHFIEEFYQDAK